MELKQLYSLLGSLPSKGDVSPDAIVDALSAGARSSDQIHQRVSDLAGDLLVQSQNLPTEDLTKLTKELTEKTYPELVKNVKTFESSGRLLGEYDPSTKRINIGLNKSMKPADVASNTMHELAHAAQDKAGRITGRPSIYSPMVDFDEFRKLYPEFGRFSDEKLKTMFLDPGLKAKGQMTLHHLDDLAKGAEATVASRVLSNKPVVEKVAKKAGSKLSKKALKSARSLASIPGIGTLLGLGMAVATKDASAALPLWADLGSKTGSEEGSPERMIEEGDYQNEEEYNELMKIIGRQ